MSAAANKLIRSVVGGGGAKVYEAIAPGPIGSKGTNDNTGNYSWPVNKVNHNGSEMTIKHALPPGAVISAGQRIIYTLSDNQAYLIQPFISTIRATLTGNLLPSGFGDLAVTGMAATSRASVAVGESFVASQTGGTGTYDLNFYGIPIQVIMGSNETAQIAAALAPYGIELESGISGGNLSTGAITIVPRLNAAFTARANGSLSITGSSITWPSGTGVIGKTVKPSYNWASVNIVNPYANKAFTSGAIVMCSWAGDSWYIVGGDCASIFTEGEVP